jgi:hypothetical protein
MVGSLRSVRFDTVFLSDYVMSDQNWDLSHFFADRRVVFLFADEPFGEWNWIPENFTENAS